MMDADLNYRLQYELKLLENDKKEHEKALRRLRNHKGFILKKSSRPKGGEYYYYKTKRSGKFRYLGGKDHPDVIHIKEEKYHTEAIKRIDNNIDLVRSLAHEFLPYDPGSVNDALSVTYRNSSLPASTNYQIQGKKWKSDRLVYQAGFPENHPENKTETTSDGTSVRTLSEVLIYERFLSAGLFFVYELPLVSADHGPNMYPDFTVLSPLDFKTEIIIEYVGRLDLKEYREAFAMRIHRYRMNGYIPGVNLFFIFGDKKGLVDSMQISKVIADIKGLR